MDRNKFLQGDVAAFVEWLAMCLPTLEVRLRFARSQFVPEGIDAAASGIEDVLAHYHWRACWKDSRTGETVESGDWVSTRASLERLSAWLRESVARGDELSAAKAARGVLRWGGVRGAIPFIEAAVRRNALCAYLNELAPLLALDGQQTLDALHRGNVQRFDSGMTKIHALFDTTGSPIFDSRVGAALAKLYEMFRRDSLRDGVERGSLGFPSGSARGRQIRNPGDLGLNYAASPQFHTSQVRREDWARWQLRAGWIIRAVLKKNGELFANEPAGEAASHMAARCHAFEAALFMIGYDLRSLLKDGESVGIVDAQRPRRRSTQAGMWVPTGHVFRTALQAYREYREVSDIPDLDDFKQWLAIPPQAVRYETMGRNFDAYCYPLVAGELDIACRTLDEIRAIESGVKDGLYLANNGESEFIETDERVQVCLVCPRHAPHASWLRASPVRRAQQTCC
jgi:hypothetical protein